MAIRERLAPDSEDMAKSLSGLGSLSQARGDFAAADAYFRRSLAIRVQRTPGRLPEATTLTDLGALASKCGRMVEAESYEAANAVAHRLADAVKAFLAL